MKRTFFLFLTIFLFIVSIQTSVLCQWNYYIRDHLGNTRVVLDENGNVKEYYDYEPFGLSLRENITGNEQARYKFTGKELDDRNGLNWYDFGARYYDPAIGRFLSPDRFAEKYPSLSPYQYAANNPLKFIDVNGDSIDTSNLNKEQLSAFNSVLESLLKSDKFKKIWETLSSSLSIYKIQINPDQQEGALYGPNSSITGSGGNFSFRSLEALTYFNMFSHEAYHAFEHDQAWPGYVVGIEIEANLFQNAISRDLYNKGIGNGLMFFDNPDSEFGRAFAQLHNESFNQQAWVKANKTFYRSDFNADGRYDKMGVRIYNPLIRQFYPLIKW